MTEYQPKYDPERLRQVAAAIATKHDPILQWSDLEQAADTRFFHERLQSVEQEQLERAFDHIFDHILYSSRNRDRYQKMFEARLGLKDGRVHTLLEVTDEFDFKHPRRARDAQDDLLKKLRVYHVVDSVKGLVE